MITLKCWPPQDNALPAYHSHLVITFGAPLSDKMRSAWIQQLRERINWIKGWTFYIPRSDSDGIEESVGSYREYGALYSTSDMTVFDRVVEQFQRFERKNELNFTHQFIIDMQDLSNRYHQPKVEWNLGQKKVQSVLVNQKRKVSAFIKEKWERERLERMSKRKQSRDKHNERVLININFAKCTEEQKTADKERR